MAMAGPDLSPFNAWPRRALRAVTALLDTRARWVISVPLVALGLATAFFAFRLGAIYHGLFLPDNPDLIQPLADGGVPVVVTILRIAGAVGAAIFAAGGVVGILRPKMRSLRLQRATCIASNTEAFEKKKTVHIEEWITTSNGERKLVALTKTPMLNDKGEVKFLVCCGNDITESRRKEEELRLAAKKLNLSGSLLRHDILNQLSVIMGYTGMAAEEVKSPRVVRYLNRTMDASKAIKKALEFAKEYQEVGTKAPVWKNLKESLDQGLVGLSLTDISLFTDLEGIEVYADPMLDRVFHNLVDNACRHGERVRSINISCSRVGENLVLVCEDDGVGVPEDMRDRLFSEGHGLQMVRDILGMTGIKIEENGKKGKGARFEIIVPKGNFRLTA